MLLNGDLPDRQLFNIVIPRTKVEFIADFVDSLYKNIHLSLLLACVDKFLQHQNSFTRANKKKQILINETLFYNLVDLKKISMQLSIHSCKAFLPAFVVTSKKFQDFSKAFIFLL